nr:ROK family protein [Roseibium aggregatum]
MIAEGFLVEQATARSAMRGRPNVGLYLNPAGLHVLCIVLSRYEQKISIVDLTGQRVAEGDIEQGDKRSSASILDYANQLITRVSARPETHFGHLAGISMIVSPDIVSSERQDQESWLDILENDLHAAFDAPVARSSIAEALHIAETRQTLESPTLPSVMIHAGFALDASMIVSSDTTATTLLEGNLNNVPRNFNSDTNTWATLNDIASAEAILHRLGHTGQAEASGQTGLRLGVPHAIRQANSGDRRATTAFREAGEAVGVAIAALVSILIPAQVILAGPLASATPFLEGFRASLQHIPTGESNKTAVMRSTLSDLGAAEAAGLEWFAFSEMTLDPGEA